MTSALGFVAANPNPSESPDHALPRIHPFNTPNAVLRDADDLVLSSAVRPVDGPVFSLLTSQRLHCEQGRDLVISLVVQTMKAGNLKDSCGQNFGIPKWYRRRKHSLIVVDGLLCQKRKTSNGFSFRIVLPKSLIADVLDKLHDGEFGHLEIEPLRGKVETMCTWPGMRRDITDKVTSCLECHANNIPLMNGKGWKRKMLRYWKNTKRIYQEGLFLPTDFWTISLSLDSC